MVSLTSLDSEFTGHKTRRSVRPRETGVGVVCWWNGMSPYRVFLSASSFSMSPFAAPRFIETRQWLRLLMTRTAYDRTTAVASRCQIRQMFNNYQRLSLRNIKKKKKKSETQPNSRAKSRRYSPVFESVRIGSGVLVSGELCRIQWVLITSTCWSLQALILCQVCLVFNLNSVCVLIHLVTWNTWLWHFV